MDIPEITQETFLGARVTITLVPYGFEFHFEVDVKDGEDTGTIGFGNTRDFSDDDAYKLFNHLVAISLMKETSYLENQITTGEGS